MNNAHQLAWRGTEITIQEMGEGHVQAQGFTFEAATPEEMRLSTGTRVANRTFKDFSSCAVLATHGAKKLVELMMQGKGKDDEAWRTAFLEMVGGCALSTGRVAVTRAIPEQPLSSQEQFAQVLLDDMEMEDSYMRFLRDPNTTVPRGSIMDTLAVEVGISYRYAVLKHPELAA